MERVRRKTTTQSLKNDVCEIQTHQSKSLAKVVGVKKKAVGDDCKFVTNTLGFPSDTLLTRIISNGAYGIVANFMSPSSGPLVVKIVLLRNEDDPKAHQLETVNIDRNPRSKTNWNAVKNSDVHREAFIQSDVYAMYKSKGLFSGLPVIITRMSEIRFISTNKASMGLICYG